MKVYSDPINRNIALFEDGTKVRMNKYDAEYPESMDVKITNKCEHNCSFCHESSNINGACFDVNKTIKLFKDLPFPTEIALGGGNLRHVVDAINYMIKKLPQCIFNCTLHVKDIDCVGKIHANAFGISIDNSEYIIDTHMIKSYSDRFNIVIHMVMGIHNPVLLRYYLEKCDKILILGYKQYGRGKTYCNNNRMKVEYNIAEWRNEINLIMQYLKDGKIKKKTIAFDNLAIKQIGLEDNYYYNPEWYMGHDGEYSMYLDLCEDQEKYALSSSSENRFDISNNSIKDMFRYLKNNKQIIK